MTKRTDGKVLDEEHDHLLNEIAEVVGYPELWLNTPHGQLGGRPPRSFLDSAAEREILNSLVQAIKHGMVT